MIQYTCVLRREDENRPFKFCGVKHTTREAAAGCTVRNRSKGTGGYWDVGSVMNSELKFWFQLWPEKFLGGSLKKRAARR